jgi:NAD(P)-dependent dehydrogenase (short-subunit alcohol dehydrogenase family)
VQGAHAASETESDVSSSSNDPDATRQSFHGKRALVTGSGGGIGRAIAHAFARRGAHVIVADIDGDAATTVVQEIAAEGGHASAEVVDIGKERDVTALFGSISTTFGTLDILVNNAGLAVIKPLLEYTEADWKRQMAVNVNGLFGCSRAAARMMRRQGAGKIVNVASISAYISSRTPEAVYDVTKGCVRQLTVSLAKELAPDNINVNAVAPGTVRTGMNRATLHTEAQRTAATARIPLGRVGTPDDIAGPVMFLCSPDAAYVTGHVLVVDGGRLLT